MAPWFLRGRYDLTPKPPAPCSPKPAIDDEAAIAIVREVARYVGYGCVTIFNGYNPEHIIIGDIVSEAGPILLDEVRATVAERAIPEINASTSISLSTLSADAVVSSAAAVAVTQFLEHPSVFFDVS